jgi:hypothetical protein
MPEPFRFKKQISRAADLSADNRNDNTYLWTVNEELVTFG